MVLRNRFQFRQSNAENHWIRNRFHIYLKPVSHNRMRSNTTTITFCCCLTGVLSLTATGLAMAYLKMDKKQNVFMDREPCQSPMRQHQSVDVTKFCKLHAIKNIITQKFVYVTATMVWTLPYIMCILLHKLPKCLIQTRILALTVA